MLVVVSISQAPSPGVMVAPSLVLPASQVKVGTICAEALATPKSMASKKHMNAEEFCNLCFRDLPQAASCSFIFIGVFCLRDSVFICWVELKSLYRQRKRF